ncbi:MAG: PorV/PorQ family protein [bacterium]
MPNIIKVTRIVCLSFMLMTSLDYDALAQPRLDKSLVKQATGAAGLFLRMGVGARALGMGGAFTGIANDPSAAYWNPSGLGQIHNFQFEFMNVNLPFDRTLNFFSTTLPLKKFMTFGVSWVGFRVNNVEARSSNSTEPDFLFSNSQNAFFFSLGTALSSTFSLGGSVKVIRNELGDFTANGLGFDAAILYKPLDKFSLGLMLQDVGTDYRWDGGLTEGVPMTMRLGTSWKILDGVILAADVSKTADETPEFHIGGEFRPVQTLPIRFGWNDGQITGGAGVVLPLSNHLLELNYGYSNDRIFNDAIHRVSLVFSLEKKSRVGYNRPRSKRAPRPRSAESPTRDFTTQSGIKIVVTARLLNVRTGPGTKYRKIGQVKRGEKFDAFERRGNWRKIRINQRQMGWVHIKYIKEVKR